MDADAIKLEFKNARAAYARHAHTVGWQMPVYCDICQRYRDALAAYETLTDAERVE